MRIKKSLAAMLVTIAVFAAMLTASYAISGDTEAARMKNIKITHESITSLLTDSKDLDGIVIVTLPDVSMGKLCIGNRSIIRGEGVAVENLKGLYFAPASGVKSDVLKNASFGFTPVYKNGFAGDAVLYPLGDKIRVNNTPIAENISLLTFKNISITGAFSGIDPDADSIHYSVLTAPKLGSVVFDESGSFVYKPSDGKTGTDIFSYMALDDSGAFSMPATITVRIEKQATKLTYSDMEGEDSHYAALVLSENGIFTGKTIGNCTYFEPDELITRGEFIAMAVAMSGNRELNDVADTGFIDDTEIPVWCKPFANLAVEAGYIRGSGTEDAPIMRANDYITRAEAAVVINNTASLADVATMRYYSDDDMIPVWAKQSVVNVDTLGIMPCLSNATSSPDTAITRADAAKILLNAMNYKTVLKTDGGFFSWFK